MVETFIALIKYFPQFNASIVAGLLIFMRLAAFFTVAPVFNRKEIPSLVKICIAFLMSIIITMVLKPGLPPKDFSLILSSFLNISFGLFIGFIAQTIFAVVASAGDMINMQMGLSSSMMFDQSTRSQSSVLGTFLSLFGVIAFLHLGGAYWLINAFLKTFTMFPVFGVNIPLHDIMNLEYLILITSNVFSIGLQLAAPVLLATLGMDIILGLISKTAPQVNVFSLSFLFKPLLGTAILVWIFPILLNVLNDYFLYYSKIF